MPSHPERVRRNQPEVNKRPFRAWMDAVQVTGLDTLTRMYDQDFSGDIVPELIVHRNLRHEPWTPLELAYQRTIAELKQELNAVASTCEPRLDPRACPRCAGPSLSGGICLACLRGPDAPTAETPWGV